MFDDHSPIYRQIAEQIKAQVLRGVLKAEEKVMSTNQYAADYRINPATAQKAFQQLVDEGVIYKRRGVGMFVSADAPRRLRDEKRERFFTDVLEPMVAEARTLGIPAADVVARIQQLFTDDDRGEGR
ncbi:GntR family transcriptional regulator [Actinoplanes sp. NPDC023714]|uniref:GntR family transcriptional regulator n=1 Tax=Actinoplanes sp. NPDC023714 TaxID=3154322 RepID=UPI0033CEDA1A